MFLQRLIAFLIKKDFSFLCLENKTRQGEGLAIVFFIKSQGEEEAFLNDKKVSFFFHFRIKKVKPFLSNLLDKSNKKESGTFALLNSFYPINLIKRIQKSAFLIIDLIIEGFQFPYNMPPAAKIQRIFYYKGKKT